MVNMKRFPKYRVLVAFVLAAMVTFPLTSWALEPGEVVYEDENHKIVYMGSPEYVFGDAVEITDLYPVKPSYAKGSTARVTCEYKVRKRIRRRQSKLKIRKSFKDKRKTGWWHKPHDPGSYSWTWSFPVPIDAKTGKAKVKWTLQSRQPWSRDKAKTFFVVTD